MDIFGKDEGLNLSDIENAIKSDILHENDEIEFKDIDRASKNDRKQKIVSELTSFLNSGRGWGLLILGLGEDNGEIIKNGVKSFKNPEQIRASIYGNIGSIPTNIKPFKLNIIPISMEDDKNIFLVEVQNNDLDCIYYSEIDNNTYIRRGDEAKPLKLPEFLDFLSKKNHARIFVKIEEKENTKENHSHSFNIHLINEGIEPGRFVTTHISLIGIDESDYSITGSGITKDGTSTFKQNDNTELSVPTFRGVAGYPPSSLLLYPGFGGLIGTLSIPKKDFSILIFILTYEDKGYSQQIIDIQAKNNKISINEQSKFYKPYLRL
ncbi:MAG: putative DNA binding domain-containing protein [Methanobacterium paludis]|nr:putative DNA binding domain-containing protein [Methanobacterium paludis]